MLRAEMRTCAWRVALQNFLVIGFKRLGAHPSVQSVPNAAGSRLKSAVRAPLPLRTVSPIDTSCERETVSTRILE